MPYDQVVFVRGWRLRFAPRSIEWPPGTVRLLRQHDRAQRLGRVVDRLDTCTGLLAAFAVDCGRAGDAALARIVDGSERGLSTGVQFLDMVPDPLHAGVYLVRRALLQEISLTADPVVDVARITVWP